MNGNSPTSESVQSRFGEVKPPQQEGKQNVRDDASNLRHDVVALKNDAMQAGAHALETGKKSVKHAVDSVYDGAREISHRAQSTHDQMCNYVRENPTAAVLIAVGVGALLGRIFR
ncbi:MAG: hypothetical protein SFZ23_08160 [Planctomycetota bacterium]|nr:hypothetical protein [Planctomycetota bacterium]